MRVKTNPILDIEVNDMITLKKAIRLCDELVGELSIHTVSDDASISWADNGEIIVTEKELHSVIEVLNRMYINFEDAPIDYDGSGHRILAVEFNN